MATHWSRLPATEIHKEMPVDNFESPQILVTATDRSSSMAHVTARIFWPESISHTPEKSKKSVFSVCKYIAMQSLLKTYIYFFFCVTLSLSLSVHSVSLFVICCALHLYASLVWHTNRSVPQPSGDREGNCGVISHLHIYIRVTKNVRNISE